MERKRIPIDVLFSMVAGYYCAEDGVYNRDEMLEYTMDFILQIKGEKDERVRKLIDFANLKSSDDVDEYFKNMDNLRKDCSDFMLTNYPSLFEGVNFADKESVKAKIKELQKEHPTGFVIDPGVDTKTPKTM